MKKGLIGDIQRSSLHDGPGFRTTVFLKGCPLSCAWCHNPELISYEPQIMFYPEKCIHCGRCNEGCYSGAKKICGKLMYAEDVIKEILADAPYYKNDGGVTFSGGEPFAQRDFLESLIDGCKAEGINCGVETSLIYYDEKILKKLDFVMADIKIWDDNIHKKYTGVSNKQILEHFIKLNGLNIPVIARTPVIPEINQEISKISGFLKGLNNVVLYELLSYHPLGIPKKRALLEKENVFSIPDRNMMKELSYYEFKR